MDVDLGHQLPFCGVWWTLSVESHQLSCSQVVFVKHFMFCRYASPASALASSYCEGETPSSNGGATKLLHLALTLVKDVTYT